MVEKITQEKVKELCISSLPTRPNAPASSGGAGYSSSDMKEAFDALTLFVIEKFNELIDAIRETGENSLSGAMPTGILEDHTLAVMFEDVKNGNLASYLTVGESSLATALAEINSTLDKIKEKIKL